MRYVIFLLYLTFSGASYCNEPQIQEIRNLYELSAERESDCLKMMELLKGYTESNNALLYGYKACATAMMAKHVFNPFSKLSYFSEGTKMLEKAIRSDKENPELRFLRYTLQTNAPAFLGYNSNISEDRIFLKKAITKMNDLDLTKKISTYLQKTS